MTVKYDIRSCNGSTECSRLECYLGTYKISFTQCLDCLFTLHISRIWWHLNEYTYRFLYYYSFQVVGIEASFIRNNNLFRTIRAKIQFWKSKKIPFLKLPCFYIGVGKARLFQNLNFWLAGIIHKLSWL